MWRHVQASLIAVAPFLGIQCAAADDLFVSIPDQRTGDHRPIVSAVGAAFDGLQPSDSFSFLNSADGSSIVSFGVPDKSRYRLAAFRDKDFAAQKSAIKNFLSGMAQSEETAPSGLRSSLLDVLSAIGEIRGGQSDNAHVLIVASPLHVDENDPSVSMMDDYRNIRVPSDSMMVGSLLLSPYGRQGATPVLEGVAVHICAILPDLGKYEQTALAQFWGRYIALRGGVLATFSAAMSVCLQRFAQRLSNPIELKPLDVNAAQVMVQARRSNDIAVMRVNERASTAEQLDRDRLTNRIRITELESELARMQGELDQARRRHREAERLLAASQAEKADMESSLNELQQVLNTGHRLEGVTTFTRFQFIEHPTDDGREVSTGTSYQAKAFPAYDMSWCYVYAYNNSGARLRVDLGRKYPDRDVEWDTPRASVLKDAGITEEAFANYRRSCRFPEK